VGTWFDQRFTAAGVFACGDVAEGDVSMSITVSMSRLVIQDLIITDVALAIKMVMTDGAIVPVVQFSGSMEVMEFKASASFAFGADQSIALDTAVVIEFPMIGDIADGGTYCKLTVALHAALPIKKFGDLKGSGTIEVINFPDVGFGKMDDLRIKGDVFLELGGDDGDFRLKANLAIKSEKKIKLWGFIEIDLPLDFTLSVESIDGVIRIRLAMMFKGRCRAWQILLATSSTPDARVEPSFLELNGIL